MQKPGLQNILRVELNDMKSRIVFDRKTSNGHMHLHTSMSCFLFSSFHLLVCYSVKTPYSNVTSFYPYPTTLSTLFSYPASLFDK
jgi:hypothetical protein